MLPHCLAHVDRGWEVLFCDDGLRQTVELPDPWPPATAWSAHQLPARRPAPLKGASFVPNPLSEPPNPDFQFSSCLPTLPTRLSSIQFQFSLPIHRCRRIESASQEGAWHPRRSPFAGSDNDSCENGFARSAYTTQPPTKRRVRRCGPPSETSVLFAGLAFLARRPPAEAGVLRHRPANAHRLARRWNQAPGHQYPCSHTESTLRNWSNPRLRVTRNRSNRSRDLIWTHLVGMNSVFFCGKNALVPPGADETSPPHPSGTPKEDKNGRKRLGQN